MLVIKSDDKSFLYFEDITEKYDDSNGWITVVRFDSLDERDCRSVFSAMAPNNKTTRAYLLSTTSWNVQVDNFGHPYFKGRDKIEFSLGNRILMDDSIIESFVVYRTLVRIPLE